MSHHRHLPPGRRHHPVGKPPAPSHGRMTYSLLKGSITAAKPFSRNPNKRPHYHLLIQNAEGEFDVAINMASEDPRVEDVRVLYAIKNAGTLQNLAAIQSFNGTIVDLDSDHRPELRLDYVSQHIVARNEMSPLPLFEARTAFGAKNDIMEFVDQAVKNPKVNAYAFGHRYTDQAPVNDAWKFRPDAGVHNIHMNQGNARGNHDNENGRSGDGALLLHFTDTNTWEIACIAFQTQSWSNDGQGFPK